MRIFIWLAVALGAAAMASAAPARPGGAAQGGGGLKVGWSSGGGHHGGKAAEGWGYGPVRARPRHGRHHRRFEGWDFQPWGARIAGPVGEVHAYGSGFFNGGGGRVRLNGGRPVFDYDRSYPYQWPSAAERRAEGEGTEELQAARPGPRCTFENGVRVCRGW